MNGYLEIVHLLLSNGAKIDQPDSSLNYPIHYAVAYGWVEILDLLIKCGANINCQNIWMVKIIYYKFINILILVKSIGCWTFKD